MTTIDIPGAAAASGVVVPGSNCRCFVEREHISQIEVTSERVTITHPVLDEMTPDEHDALVAYMRDLFDVAVFEVYGKEVPL